MVEAPPLAARRAFEMLIPIGPTPAGVVARERLGRELAVIEARNGGEAQFAERLRAQFGVTPLAGPRRTSAGDLAFLGLGPGRWLAISPANAIGFCDGIERALAGAASVIEQTDGLALMLIGGPQARATFAKGLPINLDASAFAIDDVAVSAVAHIGVTLWLLDDAPTFEVAVPRSYAGAFVDWLRESAAEFGLGADS